MTSCSNGAKENSPGLRGTSYPGYVNGLDYFISPKYVNACTKDEEFRSWREFFRQVSVKDAPDNGVEDFAMNFAIERLQALFNSIEAVDKRNFGYDLQALDQKSEKVHIEVKGLSSDGDVELTGNEALFDSSPRPSPHPMRRGRIISGM